MKRLSVLLLALILMAALAVPALAAPAPTDVDLRRTTKKVNIYAEKDTKSTVLGKLAKDKDVLVEVVEGDWVGMLVQDPEGDGQTIGWIQAKYLECKHNWTEWTTDRKATCTKAGQRSRYCTRCGKEQTKEIEKLEHEFGKWKIVTEATCSKDGLKTRTCSVCDYKQEKTYREDHVYYPWTVTREATCTQEGSMQRACQVCGYQDVKAIQKLPHTYRYQILVEATDHSSGTRAQVCEVCGYTTDTASYDPEGTMRRGDRGESVRQLQQLLVDQGYLNAGGADGVFGGGTEKALIQFQMSQGLAADGVAWPQTQQRLSHDFGPWETVRAMTRNEAGERVRTCKDCGYVQRETIEAGSVIAFGSRGEQVRALQKILKQVGYDAGGFDGVYGRKLDGAFTQFDATHGLTFEPGKVRPADVDALVNAWLTAGASTLREGGAGNPISMALSVTPASDASSDASATTYNWTLTNLGSGSCTFNALLLNYGDAPDFTHDSLVMVIDGQELKSMCGNNLSGSFTVASNWGEGSLNFAAVAVDERSDAKWLSNKVVFEVAGADESRTVEPMPVELNVNALQNGEYPVAFDRGDIARVNSGIYMNAVHVFTVDTYDRDAIEALREGDTVVVEGNAIAVKAVESREDDILVNGGLDGEDGCVFTLTEEMNAYRVLGYDDMPTYTERGTTTLPVDASARFTDASDIDSDPQTVEYGELYDAIMGASIDSFDQYNTTVTVENGRVVEIRRVYVP